MSLVERPAPPASSPRPTFDGPALIRRADVTRHVWGDAAAGEVYDWIYASTERVHMLVFGLSPGGGFRHSEDFRTIFAADELLHVLQGVLVIADPETGEVQRAGTGESVFFRRDTWHHAFALGPEPLRVLELFAPPPAAGASSAYARAQPYLEQSRYADDALLGHWPPASPPRARLRVLRPADVLWRRDLGVLCGVLVSTEHLTVATLEIGPGEAAAPHEHGGDEVLMVLDGTLWVRAWFDGGVHVFELEPEDVCYLPAGSRHEYRNARRRDRPRDLRRRAELAAVTLAVGVDVGATKIAAARVDVERGEILAARRVPTAAQRGPDAVLADCRALAAELGDGVAAAGIAVCELVDPSGRVCSAETVDWRRRRPAAARSTGSSPTCARRRSPRRASAPGATSPTSST